MLVAHSSPLSICIAHELGWVPAAPPLSLFLCAGSGLGRGVGMTGFAVLPADTASRQGPIEAIQRSVRLFEDKRHREMRRKNIIGQVCDTPKSYDNVMHVGLRKVTFKWQRGNKIGKETEERDAKAVAVRSSGGDTSLG